MLPRGILLLREAHREESIAVAPAPRELEGGPVVPCCDRHMGICLSWLLTDLSEGNKFPMKSYFSLVSLDAHGYNFPYGAKVVQRKSRA